MSKFYVESLGCSQDLAHRIEKFVSFCFGKDAVFNVRPWAKNGRFRIYFEFWSQNSLPPFSNWPIVGTFYCPEQNEIFGAYSPKFGGGLYSSLDLLNFSRGKFSGAKTRESIKNFLREFNCEKTHWN